MEDANLNLLSGFLFFIFYFYFYLNRKILLEIVLQEQHSLSSV